MLKVISKPIKNKDEEEEKKELKKIDKTSPAFN